MFKMNQTVVKNMEGRGNRYRECGAHVRYVHSEQVAPKIDYR